jgi:hypothetical protein
MIRTSIIVLSAMALTLAASAGCDKAADDQQKATSAQAEADKKIAEANKDAVTKTTGAQIEADKTIAAAQADFAKRREDYRHRVQTDLVDLDKKIDMLEVKAKTATGKVKTDLDANLASIRAQRKGFNTDLTEIDSANANQWDNAKARADKDWTDLKTLVDKAY